MRAKPEGRRGGGGPTTPQLKCLAWDAAQVAEVTLVKGAWTHCCEPPWQGAATDSPKKPRTSPHWGFQKCFSIINTKNKPGFSFLTLCFIFASFFFCMCDNARFEIIFYAVVSYSQTPRCRDKDMKYMGLCSSQADTAIKTKTTQKPASSKRFSSRTIRC